MSSDRELTRIVRSWLEEGVNALPDRVLDDVLTQLPVTSQRRPWWRAWRKNLMNGTFKFAAVGLAAIAVAAIGLAVYFSRPAVTPAATQTPGLSPSVTVAAPTQPAVVPATDAPTSPTLTTQPTQTGDKAPWVVFTRGDGRFGTPDDLWAMRTDGSDAHEIMTGLDFPNIAWSKDGRRLLVVDSDSSGMSRVYLSDVSDVIGPFIDKGFGTGSDTACIEKSRKPFPCQDWGLSFAPDGERVVLLQTCTYTIPGCGFLTILDLRTGERTELSETLQQGRSRGQMGVPAWSSDGSMIAFVQEIPSGDVDVVSDSRLYIINSDGSNLREINLSLPRVTSPQWSPDGTSLVLLSDIYSEEGGETILSQDVYTVHPDGTDLRQLTTNGLALDPQWTLSNAIRFRNRNDTEPTLDFALMDADGGNLLEYANLDTLISGIAQSGSAGEYKPPYSGLEFFWQPAD